MPKKKSLREALEKLLKAKADDPLARSLPEGNGLYSEEDVSAHLYSTRQKRLL